MHSATHLHACGQPLTCMPALTLAHALTFMQATHLYACTQPLTCMQPLTIAHAVSYSLVCSHSRFITCMQPLTIAQALTTWLFTTLTPPCLQLRHRHARPSLRVRIHAVGCLLQHLPTDCPAELGTHLRGGQCVPHRAVWQVGAVLCVCVYVCACMCVRACLRMSLCACRRACACLHVSLCVHVGVYVRACV